MKAIVFLAIIAFAAADIDYYDLEKLDMDKIGNDQNEFKSFVDCLLDRKECTKLYGSYRAITEEAIEQICKRCTPYQKHTYWQFLHGLADKFPQEYHDYRQKFDPEHKYIDSLESELKKYSIAY